MNLKKSNFLLTLVILFFLMGVSASAQYLSTVYVSATDGVNTNTGESADKAVATIGAGLLKVADGGKLVIIAGDYTGSGFAGEDINIDNTPGVGHPTQITTGITILLKPGGTPVSNLINITAGSFIVNLTGTGTKVTIDNYTGYTSAYLKLNSNTITLTSGNLAILNTNYFQLPGDASITLNKQSTFENNKPKADGSIDLLYTGTGDVLAGQEATYSSFGANGSITVTKASGQVTFTNGVTFPATNNGVVINLTSGSLSFGGTVDAGNGDIVNSGAGTLTLNNIAMGVKLAANGGPSLLQNTSNGTVIVTGTATWTGLENLGNAANTPRDLTTDPIIDNQSIGTLDIRGDITLSPKGATDQANVDANSFIVLADNANAAGTLKLGKVIASAVNTNTGGTSKSSYGYLQLTNTGIANLNGGIYRGFIINAKTMTNDNNALSVLGNVDIDPGVPVVLATFYNQGASSSFTATTNLTLASGLVWNEGSFVQSGAGLTIAVGTSATPVGLTNDKTMTLGALTHYGAITNTTAGAVLTLNGNSSSNGLLNNSKSIVIGANTLTLTANSNHTTNNGTISGTGTVIFNGTGAQGVNGGTFPKVTVAQGALTVSGTITANDVAVSSGASMSVNNAVVGNVVNSITLDGTLTLTGTAAVQTGNFTQNVGSTFVFTGAGVLDVHGDFSRVTSTFTAPAASTVSFTGTTAQNLNPGPQLQLGNVTFNNTGGAINVGQSLRANNVVLISPNTTVALGTNNIILNGLTASIVNNGTYTATEGTAGGIIVGGATVGVYGGIAVTGVTLAGSGVYTNIIIDAGVGNTVKVINPAGATPFVKWSQELNLVTGVLEVNAATGNIDLAPTGTVATLKRDIVNAPAGIVLNNGGGANTASFNTNVPTNYNLTYTGTIPASTTGNITGKVAGLDANHTRMTSNAHGLVNGMTVTISGTTGATYDGVHIVSNCLANTFEIPVPSAGGNLDGTGTWVRNDFPAGTELNASVNTWKISTNCVANDLPLGRFVTVPSNVTLGGTIIVDRPAQVQINTGITLTLNGASKSHVVNGLIASQTTGKVLFTGDNSSLTGSTDPLDVAEVGNIAFGTGAVASTITVTNIMGVNGTLVANALSTVNFGMGSVVADQTIDGAMTLNGTKFNLTSDLTAWAGVSQGAGLIELNNNNLFVSNNNFAQTAAGTIQNTGSSTGGWLVLNGAANINMNANAKVPKLKILGNVAANAVFEVTGVLTIGATTAQTPTFTSAANLNFTGTNINLIGNGTAVQPAILGGGILNITSPATITIDNNTIPGGVNGILGINKLTYNSTGTLNIASSYANAQTLEVGTLAQTGNINTNGNILKLIGGAGSYAQTSGNISSTGNGKVQFAFTNVGGFVPTTNMSITNLEALTSVTYAGALTLTVNNLYLTGTITPAPVTLVDFPAGKIIIAEGGNIYRDAGVTVTGTTASLANAPAFTNSVNLFYVAAKGAQALAGVTGAEVPSATTAATVLNNMTITHGGTLSLGANTQVNGTLKLVSGTLDFSTVARTLTIANGATIDIAGGLFYAGAGPVAASIPSVTSYKLIYSFSSGVLQTTAREFQASPAVVTDLSILGNNVQVQLMFGRQVGNFTLNSPAGAGLLPAGAYFDVNNQNFLVSGNFQVIAGSFIDNTDPNLAPSFTMNGGAQQNLTLAGNSTLLLKKLTVNQAGSLNNAIINIGSTNSSVAYLQFTNSGQIVFINGILNVADPAVIVLPRPNDATAVPAGLAYDRSGVIGQNVGHIVGKVQRAAVTGDGNTANNATFLFPVGTLPDMTTTPPTRGQYRELAVVFAPTYTVATNTNIIVNHAASNPDGTNWNTPTQGIGNYPQYYWMVTGNPGLPPSQKFDVKLQGTYLPNTTWTADYVNSLRVIRREDGNVATNWWTVLPTGSFNFYDNTTVENRVYVSTVSSQGGLVSSGTRFTIGMPATAPEFTATPAAIQPVTENNALTFTITAKTNKAGGTVPVITMNPDRTLPGFVNLTGFQKTSETTTTATYTFTWTPNFSAAYVAPPAVSPYVLTFTATDQTTGSTTYAVTVNVTDNNQAPTITLVSATPATATIDQKCTMLFRASDPDVTVGTETNATYTFAAAPTTAHGTVTATKIGNTDYQIEWTPDITDLLAGAPITFSVNVNDNHAVTPLSALVPATKTYATVSAGLAWGDVNKNGGVDVGDVTGALTMAASLSTPANDLITGLPYSDIQYFVANVDKLFPNTDFTTLPRHGVTAFDAYLILYKSNNHPSYLFPAEPGGALPKAGAADGSFAFGKVSGSTENNSQIVNVPLSISNAKNVNAVTFELNIDSKSADIESVKPVNLPSDWQFVQTYADNKLTVMMVGLSPLQDAKDLANVAIKITSKEANVKISGFGIVNNLEKQPMAEINVRQVPTAFELSQNYPNPFNPSTVIKYQVPQNSYVKLAIYDISGRVIKTLVNGQQEAGYYSINWDGNTEAGSKVASGMYIYRIEAGSFTSVKKMLLMK